MSKTTTVIVVLAVIGLLGIPVSKYGSYKESIASEEAVQRNLEAGTLRMRLDQDPSLMEEFKASEVLWDQARGKVETAERIYYGGNAMFFVSQIAIVLIVIGSRWPRRTEPKPADLPSS